ncbi:MAG: rRNA maturation RNase YbeY [Candidatus Omnitrophica bacterium]|nr:rRNA maturation RNase YbeY [Candidatus Omnitrophota bacterium]
MIVIETTNQQKVKRINLKQLHKDLKRIFVCLDISSKKLSILLCDNAFIKKLNKKYFKKFSVTDVIAFPLADSFQPDYLGEVIVSVEEAVRIAKRLDCRWQDELNLYLIHGILHLIGYDDRTNLKRARMEKKQEELLKLKDKG